LLKQSATKLPPEARCVKHSDHMRIITRVVSKERTDTQLIRI